MNFSLSRLCLVALLTCLGAPNPLNAQTLQPASPPTKTVIPHVTAAPRVPVVQAPSKPKAKKIVAKPTKKPAPKPEAATSPAKPGAAATGAAAGTAAGAAAASLTPATPPAAEPPPAVDPNKGSVSGLALPRFMALRFDDVNLRVGPGTRYPIDWVYHRRDLPVEILRELDDWRLVQDQDSVRGWVRAPTLTPRRGFAVRDTERVLRGGAADDAAPVARLKPGVIGRVRSCAAGSIWCEVEVATYRGWLKRDEMYGVYPNEAIGS
jgi:SH3-like domain-containing protein